MERNENDIFDELVRGKLTNYTEPVEPEWIRAIQVKKARTVSLYQLYRLMLIAIFVGAGIFAGIQLMPYQSDIQEAILKVEDQHIPVDNTSENPYAAEFASAASGSGSPAASSLDYTSVNTTTTSTDAASAQSKNHSLKEHSTYQKANKSQHKQVSTRSSNTQKSGNKPALHSENSVQPEKQTITEKESGSKNGTDTDLQNESEEKPETNAGKKEQATITPCKADFDFYTSYSGEFNFVQLAPVADNANIIWDFGDGKTSPKNSVSHVYQNSGTYEVTLTIQDGKNTCSISKNIAYQNPAEKTTPIAIAGKVVAGSVPLKNAIVELYTFDEQKGKFKSTQSIRTNQLGEYSIVLQRNTRYLLRGYPTGEAQNYLASYWGNTVESESATEIQIMPSEKDNLVGYTIQLLLDEQQADNEPIQNLTPLHPENQRQVFLVDAHNKIVGVGSVDANGHYTFGSDINPGNYNIVNPGTGESKRASVAAGGSGLSGNISDLGSSSPSSPNDKVLVYPNPANSVVNFGINSDQSEYAVLVIMDASGVERYREKILFNAGFNQAQYDVSGYSPGIYYLMIFRNNQQVSSSRIVKLADNTK